MRRICLLFSLAFFVYTALLTTRSIAGFPQTLSTHASWPWLGDKPVGEDGFYMLTVADHLARQHHLAYNYGQPATGFQPLATFLWAGIDAVVIAAGGDSWTLVRSILCFQSLLFLGFVWLLAGFAESLAPVASRKLVFFLAFVLCLFDFSLFRLFDYGLETGPYLTCLAICLVLWHRLVIGRGKGWRNTILFGLAGGVTGLARIDFGIVFAIVLVFLLVKRYLSPLQVLMCGALALAVVSPWFFYVHGVTGGWLPSSGKAEGQLITWHTLGRLPQAGVALLVHLVPWSFASGGLPPRIFALVCLLGLAAWMVAGRKSWRAAISPEMRRTLLPWAIGFGGLITVYPIFFWVSWFYPRYFAPLLVVWIPVLAVFLASQPLIRRWPMSMAVALLAIFSAETFFSLHTGHIATNHIVSAGYIRQFYPTARVGAFQSGDIGFFNSNVVNLDGKMNDDALHADATHRLDDYLDRSHINVLVDWEALMRYHLPDAYLAAKWQACPQPMPITNSVCLLRKAP